MIRIAIIGAGRIGHVHARAIANHPDAQLVAVCDPVNEAAKALADAYQCQALSEPSQVFSSPDIDAVIIGSPTAFHCDHILAAVKAGKHVMCEKPIALDLDSAKRCIEELGEKADRVMMGFNRRFDPTFAEIHRRSNEGEIGELQQLLIISRDPQAPSAEYVAGSGGIFKDMTIHDFDMARFFLGDIVEVCAVGTNVDPAIKAAGDFDQVIVTLKNAEGHTATIINSRSCSFGYDQRLEAFGATGMLSADNLTETAVRKASATQTETKSAVLNFFLERYQDAFRIELNTFISHANQGGPIHPSVRDGYKALQLAQAAHQSAHEGRVVTLS